MDILCLDLEGVLIPEIWQGVAARTGVEELNRTTRDIPVYDDLMQFRLSVMRERQVDLTTVHAVIEQLEPLAGATAFLAWARQRFQVAIISDTFYEFAMPLMAKLGHPLLLCHRLQTDGERITGYTLRQDDPKRHSVMAFKSLGFKVSAAGDSFNDVPMLEEADRGFFFQAPDNVVAAHPQFQRAGDYPALQDLLAEAQPSV